VRRSWSSKRRESVSDELGENQQQEEEVVGAEEGLKILLKITIT
jgi:hypothetical protein